MQDIMAFIVRHWWLVAAFVVVLILVIAEEVRAKSGGGAKISAAGAVQLINKDSAFVLDVRDNSVFLDGHIVNAKNIEASSVEQSIKRLQKYKDKPVIVVCAQGQSALVVAAKLKAQQFSNVQVLSGGMAAWREAGLPTVKGG